MPTTVTAAAISDSYEGGAAGVIRLTRTDTSGPLGVNISMSGTATPGMMDDYLDSTMANFADGNATVDVFITANNDSTSEPTETVTCAITSGLNYTVGSPASATINMLDNDSQVVSVAKIDDPTEGGTGKFRFTRIGDLSSSLTANYSVGGTATSTTDYTALGGTVAFSANSATADVNVVSLADNIVESGETVSVTVGTGTGYSVGSPSSATVTIADDPPIISVTASDTVEASATGGFTFTRRGGDISSSLAVDYTVSGTATASSDYTELTGSVTFPATEDSVEVPVEAPGENVAEDDETVIVTISSGGTDYEIDEEADVATCTIADQALTVSVQWLADGEEGAGNGSFRFTRAGDISESLTIDYTVSGTATGGTDYTSLSGSVTFAAESDHTDVTVTVINDSSVETTETVIVTIDEDEAYEIGNDSDTLFIKDNDAGSGTVFYWTNEDANPAHDGLWNYKDNWRTAAGDHAVPGEDDIVYFTDNEERPYHSSDPCTDLGSGSGGLSFAAFHMVDGYSGYVTLNSTLSAGTYEQTVGILNQPSGDHLTITDAFLWSGGTLNAVTDSVSNVNIDSAEGRIDPPNTGSMGTGSTLRVIGGSVVRILAGTLEFAAGTGDGMYVGADSKVRVLANSKALVGLDNSTKTLTLALGSTWEFVGSGQEDRWDLRVINNGGVFKVNNVRLTLAGGDAKTPSYTNSNNANAALHLVTGSALDPVHGLKMEGGSLYIINQGASQHASLQGAMTISGGDIVFSEPPVIDGARRYAALDTSDAVTWSGGTFRPNIDCSASPPTSNCDQWQFYRPVTIVTTGGSPPQITPNPAYIPTGQGIPTGRTWEILAARDRLARIELTGTSYPALPDGKWEYETTVQENKTTKWRVKRTS